VVDTAGDRLVIVGTNYHVDNPQSQNIVWDSDTAEILALEGERLVPLDPPGFSSVSDARWYPDLIESFPHNYSLLLVPDPGNMRLLGIDWRTGVCIYNLDFSGAGIRPFSAAFVTGQPIPDVFFIGSDPSGERERMLYHVDVELDAAPVITSARVIDWDDPIYSVRYVENISHPDTYDDDGEPGDDPPYGGPALIFCEEGDQADRIHVWGLPNRDFSETNILMRYMTNNPPTSSEGVEARHLAASADGSRLVLADYDRQSGDVQFRGFRNNVDWTIEAPWDEDRILRSGDIPDLAADGTTGASLVGGDYDHWVVSLEYGTAFSVDWLQDPPQVDWILDVEGISGPGPVEKMLKPAN
jgi:hypothetical protein